MWENSSPFYLPWLNQRALPKNACHGFKRCLNFVTHYLSHALVHTVNTHGSALWSHQSCKTLIPGGNPLSAPCAFPPRQPKADGNNLTTGQTDRHHHPLILVNPHRLSVLTSLCAYRVSLVKIHSFHSLQRLFQNPLFSNLQLPHLSPPPPQCPSDLVSDVTGSISVSFPPANLQTNASTANLFIPLVPVKITEPHILDYPSSLSLSLSISHSTRFSISPKICPSLSS